MIVAWRIFFIWSVHQLEQKINRPCFLSCIPFVGRGACLFEIRLVSCQFVHSLFRRHLIGLRTIRMMTLWVADGLLWWLYELRIAWRSREWCTSHFSEDPWTFAFIWLFNVTSMISTGLLDCWHTFWQFLFWT